jgi:hypothetical protein
VKDLFLYSGSGNTAGLGVAFARVIFAGSFIFFAPEIAAAYTETESAVRIAP